MGYVAGAEVEHNVTANEPSKNRSVPVDPTAVVFEPQTLDELLSATPDRIAACDIARMNLLCASGLPGAEGLEIAPYLLTLRDWASRIETETNDQFFRFRKQPARFRKSPAFFRAMMLGTVLHQDYKIKYNRELENRLPGIKNLTKMPMDSRHIYLHGLLGPSRIGSCASMPVLYIAIGRRLGYPHRLVRAPSHLYARWENKDSAERFNIEATDHRGLSSMADEFYIEYARKRNRKFFQRDVDNGFYLQSLNPAETLGTFMGDRAACLYSHKRWMEAIHAYDIGGCLNPKDSNAANGASWAIERLLCDQRPERHPLATKGADPLDPRHVLSPEDAACCCNIAGHCYEIWCGEKEPRLAWGAYLEAARLAPNEPRYARDVERFRRKLPAIIANGPAPGFFTFAFCSDQYFPSPFPALSLLEGGSGSASNPAPTTRPTPTVPPEERGLRAERAGHLAEAQACFAQAVLMRPDAKSPSLFLLRAVRNELGQNAPPPVPDPRDALQPEGKAAIFAAKGAVLEGQGDFLAARHAYAFAAHFQPQRREYRDSIIRADAKAQERLYREQHGGAAPPPTWRPMVLKNVTAIPRAPGKATNQGS